MLISASIIVKNEEGIIQRCLDCVSLFADEIVVVDTGSTDRTKEIASRHPKVKLFDSEYFNKDTDYPDFRFNVAKNEALEKCSGKWVIWWDADDFIDEENAANIRRVAESTEEVCLFTFTMEYGPITFEHCRMLKNGNGIFFDKNHSVHEYLMAKGFPNYLRRDIKIEHRPGKKSVPAGDRNIAIMEKDHFERGLNDPRTLFYLANGYREIGRNKDAVEFYDKYLSSKEANWSEERFFARYYMGQALVVLGELSKARNQALMALTEDFRFAETYSLLGDIAFKEGDFKRAQSWFMMAVDTPYPKNAKLFVTRSLYEGYPGGRIADCHKAITQEQDLKKKMGDMNVMEFELPEEKDEAVMAASVLASISANEGKFFKVSTNCSEAESIVESSERLLSSQGNGAVSLILPPNLKGRSREEWYGRAAGHVSEDWEPIVTEARKIAGKVLNAD